MDNFLIQLLLLVLTIAYLTHIFVLERKTSHYGPFQSEDKVVLFKPDEEFDDEHMQPVTLFDWVRRVFGVYKIEKHVWTVQETPAARWSCPVCLSFWMALVVVTIYLLVPFIFVQNFLLIFSLACASALINVNGLP